MLGGEKDLGTTVPEGDHLVCVCFYWESKGSRQTEVRQLYYLAIRADQQILRLQIPMEYPIGMQEDQRLQDLEQETLALLWW